METIKNEIMQLEQELLEKKRKIKQLRRQIQGEPVRNYCFLSSNDKEVTILDLFGDHDELIVIHNMGKSCSYCTMWADGFNSIYHHIRKRAAFVVASPDLPSVQEDISAERSWIFPMISTTNNTFTEDTGFKKDDLTSPGVSVFTKDKDQNLFHHTSSRFGPGDEYCVVWSLFDLLPTESEGYHPEKKINKKSPFQLTNNVAVQVNDYENALHFYQNVIGMELNTINENEAKLSINQTHFFLENHPSQSRTFFEFAVDDFQPAIDLLIQEGCKVTKTYSETSVMIEDPYGMAFHVFEAG
ncbi:DUF899 family protein [Bacillus sp. H-16]|uniref:DUF899 family protein n=1 Tax=Alteribacter salitolerans TaxID=2912333 RepID=UPI00196649D7|nr:DUF899 family protein [Alteribacter salitolerans]MBM7095407.1 DUF899 family protein [Alteribacter salitolerans]